MTNEEIIYSIALTQVPGIGVVWGRNLLKAAGTAVDVFRRKDELYELIPGITKRIIAALDCPDVLLRAEKEYEFISKKNIRCLTINDKEYPSRLRECVDAPIVLYFKGNTDLNNYHVIDIVGTRNITDYGKNLCERFISELKEICPGVLIVSGLAYGVDIYAHRAALSNNLPTVGVLAHGLDRIYPATHRKTAVDMLDNGGLLTEFITGTTPDRYNFVARNRIVAGMSDATIVIESALKGGSLITAEIANGYNRECFAFPGRSLDEFSQGCNRLIRENKACLIECAEDFVESMGWNFANNNNKSVIAPTLFPELSNEEQIVVSLLESHGISQINTLVVEANIPVNKMNALLFELEMKGLVRVLAGGMYQLMK